MYGMVNNAVQELITERFGEATWQKVKARAGCDVDVFISNEGYDDKLTYDLVAAASAELGLTPDQVLEAFGEHWILHTGRKGYGPLLAQTGRTLPEFLTNLPAFHARVSLILPNLKPPRFEVSDVTEQSLHLHYHTFRPGLTAFMIGLLKGLGSMLHTPVTVEPVSTRSQGHDHDTFLVKWERQA
jgi:hypothetical protein